MSAYGTSYALAANDAGGYSLYAMTKRGHPDLHPQATTAGALWSPPPAALQPAPNQGVQLDTLDGRIQSPPVQADTFLWFTHSVALGSFPAVRYGAIPLSASGTGGASAQTANASPARRAYDWNLSIALAEPTTNSVRIFLGWAMTDPTNGVNVSMRVGVGPGEGVPSLAGSARRSSPAAARRARRGSATTPPCRWRWPISARPAGPTRRRCSPTRCSTAATGRSGWPGWAPADPDEPTGPRAVPRVPRGTAPVVSGSRGTTAWVSATTRPGASSGRHSAHPRHAGSGQGRPGAGPASSSTAAPSTARHTGGRRRLRRQGGRRASPARRSARSP